MNEDAATPRSARAAFYCVADSSYFLGAVGLVNSLRLQGHEQPIYLLDAGLTSEQRDLLGQEVTLVQAPDASPPWLLKTVAPLSRPAEVMVLLDADVLVTRPLDPLIERAAASRLVAFRNNVDRYVPGWGDLLDLGPLERRPYLCSAFVAVGREQGERVLALMGERQDRVDFARTHWRANDLDYPFLYADQDVLNAVVAALLPEGSVEALDHSLLPAIPYEGLRVADADALRVAANGNEPPYLVHAALSPKPWQRPAYDGVYPRLLRRCLSGPDLRISVPARDLPMQFRAGPLARVVQKWIDLRQQVRWRIGA